MTFERLFTKERTQASMQLLVWVVFLAVMNQLAMKFYWYSAIWWFDIPMHFLGGVFLALLGLWIAQFLLFAQKKDFTLASGVVFVLTFVFLVGSFWEVFEFVVDAYTTMRGFNVLDTVSDLCFDLAGGISALLFSLSGIKETFDSQ